MTYFKESEFNCSCCGENKMDDYFLHRLDMAREKAGVAFLVESGYRCEKRNKMVGGSLTSSHLNGHAVDIVVKGSRERMKIVEGLLSVGFNRIGIGKTFIHVDDDPAKDIDVIWVYS